MTHKNKIRGNQLEREVVKLLTSNGIEARRSWGSDGRSQGLSKEVDVRAQIGKLVFDIQCKRVKTLSQKYLPSIDVDATIYREDGNKQCYAMIKFDLLIQLLRERKDVKFHENS